MCPAGQFRLKFCDLTLVPGIRKGDLCGFSKGRSSKFHVSSRVRQTTEEGRRAYLSKRCGYNNKDGYNSSKTIMIKIIKLCLRNFYKVITFLRFLILSVLLINFVFLYVLYKGFVKSRHLEPCLHTH